jgi:hypothetical protein
MFLAKAAMLFIPIQAVAMQREKNHHRRPAESSAPVTRHITIDEGQFDHHYLYQVLPCSSNYLLTPWLHQSNLMVTTEYTLGLT